jgi:hypothetical protein
MGVAGSTLFISVQASIEPAYSAVAASTLYLAGSTGGVIGMAASSAVLQGSLRLILDRKLSEGGFDGLRKMKVNSHAFPECQSLRLTLTLDNRARGIRRSLCRTRET